MGSASNPSGAPVVPVSWGELLDKITILEIKAARILAPGAAANVRRELSLLRAAAGAVIGDGAIADLVDRLRSINETLWEVEDRIRGKDAAAEFDGEFIRLAQAVYRTNDERAAVKRAINDHLGSRLVEEKSYAPSAFFRQAEAQSVPNPARNAPTLSPSASEA